MNTKHVSVLFVCLGNICRSPMAEAVFKNMVAQEGLSARISVDSAATSHWEVGKPPHPGTREVLRLNNIPVDPTRRARMIRPEDLQNYDYVIGMDAENMSDLRRMGGKKVYRMLEFASHLGVTDIPDPWYTHNFDYTYQLVQAGCRGLLQHIRQKESI
jgi:protein-tyrosine phosphatase